MTNIDPPLPTPELTREEFNSYKKTILQEHLFGLIFNEAKSLNPSSNMELPSFNEPSPLLEQLKKLESSAFELVTEVKREYNQCELV